MLRYFLLASWIFLLYLLFTALVSHERIEPSLARQLIAMYHEVKEAPLTRTSEACTPIIEQRLQCFGHAKLKGTELKYCTQEYAFAIMEQAKETHSSLPNKAPFLQCVKLCPIMHNMCMGDNTELLHNTCIDTERRCVEYCLNKHWRGFYRPAGKAFW